MNRARETIGDADEGAPLPARRPPARAFAGPTTVVQSLTRRNLSDQIAKQIHTRISQGEYRVGDRLPPIRDIARSYGVGPPTVREGLKRLEAYGLVEIRAGSGVYVAQPQQVLVSAPRHRGGATKKLLADVIEARMPMETHAAAMAARHATVSDLQRMRQLLTSATHGLRGDLLNSAGEAFHQLVALASGNAVIGQFLEALSDLFRDEHRLIWAMADCHESDHQAHVGILEALEMRDSAAAAERMRVHLEALHNAVLHVGSAGAVA